MIDWNIVLRLAPQVMIISILQFNVFYYMGAIYYDEKQSPMAKLLAYCVMLGSIGGIVLATIIEISEL